MKIGYMCSVAWDFEVGHTDVKVYPTLRALKASLGPTPERRERHFKQCGYVKVKLTKVKRQNGTA